MTRFDIKFNIAQHLSRFMKTSTSYSEKKIFAETSNKFIIRVVCDSHSKFGSIAKICNLLQVTLRLKHTESKRTESVQFSAEIFSHKEIFYLIILLMRLPISCLKLLENSFFLIFLVPAHIEGVFLEFEEEEKKINIIL